MKTFFRTNGFPHALVFGVCAYLSLIELVTANKVDVGTSKATEGASLSRIEQVSDVENETATACFMPIWGAGKFPFIDAASCKLKCLQNDACMGVSYTSNWSGVQTCALAAVVDNPTLQIPCDIGAPPWNTSLPSGSTTWTAYSNITPNKSGACQEHINCGANEKCKKDQNMDTYCKKRKVDCKVRGTKKKKRWGCQNDKICKPMGNQKWAKCI